MTHKESTEPSPQNSTTPLLCLEDHGPNAREAGRLCSPGYETDLDDFSFQLVAVSWIGGFTKGCLCDYVACRDAHESNSRQLPPHLKTQGSAFEPTVRKANPEIRSIRTEVSLSLVFSTPSQHETLLSFCDLQKAPQRRLNMETIQRTARDKVGGLADVVSARLVARE